MCLSLCTYSCTSLKLSLMFMSRSLSSDPKLPCMRSVRVTLPSATNPAHYLDLLPLIKPLPLPCDPSTPADLLSQGSGGREGREGPGLGVRFTMSECNSKFKCSAGFNCCGCDMTIRHTCRLSLVTRSEV